MNRGIHVSVVVDALHAVTRGLEVARACHFAVIGVIGVTLPSSFLLPGYTLDSARAALFVAGAVSLVGLLLATGYFSLLSGWLQGLTPAFLRSRL